MFNFISVYSSNLHLCIGGTEGLFANKALEITDDVLGSYKNQGWYIYFSLILDVLLLFLGMTNKWLLFFQGGFDLLGRSIDQIRTTKQVNAAMTTCRYLNLDGLVVVGGTNKNS